MAFDYLQTFRDWFKLKIILWNKPNNIIFKQGDIWWCSLGINIGEEIYGKGIKFTRPVLIFRKLTSNSFLGLPLTSQERNGNWYVEIFAHGARSWVMLNQARILDKKRLTSRLTTLEDVDFKKVRDGFLNLYSR